MKAQRGASHRHPKRTATRVSPIDEAETAGPPEVPEVPEPPEAAASRGACGWCALGVTARDRLASRAAMTRAVNTSSSPFSRRKAIGTWKQAKVLSNQ